MAESDPRRLRVFLQAPGWIRQSDLFFIFLYYCKYSSNRMSSLAKSYELPYYLKLPFMPIAVHGRELNESQPIQLSTALLQSVTHKDIARLGRESRFDANLIRSRLRTVDVYIKSRDQSGLQSHNQLHFLSDTPFVLSYFSTFF